MAETPKGDTASPTDEPAAIRPEDQSSPSEDGAPDGTIAGDVGQDSLAPAVDAEAESGPWSPSEAERVEPAATRGDGDDRPGGVEPAPGSRRGGRRRTLILVILLALVIGGGYATYPVWRGEVEPLAQQFGITLPTVETAEAPGAPPEPAPEPETGTPPQAEAPAQSDAEGQPETQGQPDTAAQPDAPAPPASVPDPALAGDLEQLQDRVNALEQRLAAVEDRPETPAADPEAVARLESRVDEMAQTLTAVTDEMAIVREGLATGGGDEGLGPMAAQLSERVQGLTDRVEGLETTPAEPTVAPERLDDLQARLDVLAGNLDNETRESAESVARLETRLSDFQSRLDQVAKALESTRSGREKAGAFLLAANQLAAVAGTSSGFEAELEALRATAPSREAASAALETLGQHQSGVPSLAVLRDRFAKTASAAVDASVVGSGEGVIGQALTRVASLVTVRRTVTGEGDGLDALLVRAESALAAGDLAGAIQAMRKLDGDPATVAADWLAAAEARAAVDGAVRALQSEALAGVAGG